jgi:hypothetical protein
MRRLNSYHPKKRTLSPEDSEESWLMAQSRLGSGDELLMVEL